MKNNRKPLTDPIQLQELYYHSRFPALALALAVTLNTGEAYRNSKKAHIMEGSGSGKIIDLHSILRRVLKFSRFAESKGKEIHPALENLQKLDKEARIVWVLKTVCEVSRSDISALLKKAPETVSASLVRAEKQLNENDASCMKNLVSELLSKKELWNDITFGITQRKSIGRKAFLATCIAFLATALILAGREALTLVRVLQLQARASESTLVERYDSETYYKRIPERPSNENPRINQALMERLNEMEDDQDLRAAFRFYDRNVMLETQIDGQNLEGLYTGMYEESVDKGRIATLAANALNAYYANYKRLFKVKERDADFLSKYGSIYDAAIDIAKGSGFEQTVTAHPEIFSNRDVFEQYLFSRQFIREVPHLYNLLNLEIQIAGFRETKPSNDPQLREAYEDALFAFFNPGGYGGKASVTAFPFESEQVKQFFSLRERLGKELYHLNVQQCSQVIPADSALHSDILEGSESSLFSATFSKKELLLLAEHDDRFFFLGIAAPAAAFFDSHVEADLADRSLEGLLKKHDIYQINEDFLLYSLNYAAPLALPQGFIDDIRNKLDCEDTGFEMELQYTYQMRYAHPQTRTGYGILRALTLNQEVQFTSQDYKYFSKMAAY